MSFKVTISQDALNDMRLAARWYDKQQKGLGKEFIESVKEYKKVLKLNPFFVKRYKQVHTIPIKRFPFMIHYVIDESAKSVLIMAVLILLSIRNLTGYNPPYPQGCTL